MVEKMEVKYFVARLKKIVENECVTQVNSLVLQPTIQQGRCCGTLALRWTVSDE
jgi:hypothetical protein